MKISRHWLQEFFDAPLPDTQVLADALTFHAFEIDGIEHVGTDDVLDVKITANRGHDCLSHRGIAKEISAILQVPFKDPLRHDVLLPTTDTVAISIDTPLCGRYVAGVIKGVKVGPSPEWLRTNLEVIGQRSINNVVDATNYVMFAIGQPLHAFDAGQLVQKNNRYSIAARMARENEKVHALDGKEYTLDTSMMVIADANSDTSIGIAGVKGGTPASITETTTDIIIESATFDGPSVRKTARTLKLRTDASARFEQVITYDFALYGMQMVVDLILKIAGGELVGINDIYPNPCAGGRVAVALSQINRTLGITLSKEEVADVFMRLGFQLEQSGDIFTVTSPFERLDINIPEDLIEEVGRIIGYDKVPAQPLPQIDGTPEVNSNYYRTEAIREYLVSLGFSEVFTSVFTDEGERIIANKIDGVRPFLRASLQASLNEALEKNIRIKDLLGISQVKLFEIGTVWRDGKEITEVAIAVEKRKEFKTQEEYQNDLDASVASINPKPTSYERYPVSATAKYQPYSKYPFIVRDIAMWTPADTNAEAVLVGIRKGAGDLLVRSELFDRFEKDGKLSLAFRLIFQSFDRTLTDDEINTIMQNISQKLANQGFSIR